MTLKRDSIFVRRKRVSLEISRHLSRSRSHITTGSSPDPVARLADCEIGNALSKNPGWPFSLGSTCDAGSCPSDLQ